MTSEFEPNIIGFFCNWCSYAAADLAGISRIEYPTNVKIIRVMCSGRVGADLVLKAFVAGVDGVLVCGCHPGDCHYLQGNLAAKERFKALSSFLDVSGIGRDRLKLEWISASEAPKVADTVRSFIQTVKQVGPGPFNIKQNGSQESISPSKDSRR